jgi:hypothetical protein
MQIAALTAAQGDALDGIVPWREPPAQRGYDHN